MTKEVMLTVRGVHLDAGQEIANLETVSEAEYYKKNDCHYLFYEEETQGIDEKSQNRIKFRNDRLEMIKKGVVKTHMVFEENKTHETNYVTPFGSLLLGIHTKKIRVEEQANQIHVLIEYVLEAEEAPLSECTIALEISERR